MDFYSLVYNVGMHHIPIFCTKDNFNEVLDDLSKEFEIVKKTNPDLPNSEVYYYRNYHDQLDLIGSVSHLDLQCK